MQGFNVLFQPGLRPRRHLDAERGREAPRRGGQVAAGARPRGVRGARLGVAPRVRRQDHDPVPPHRRLARLPARALHDGRGVRARRDALLRPPLGPQGWIYRANRIINWCPFHQTSLSDLELEHGRRRRRAHLRPLSVRGRRRRASRSRRRGRRRSSPTSPSRCTRTTSATATRSASEAIVPVVERRVPVIADERVEPDFGTGALKVTPGHDPIDFEIGRDHGLPEPMVDRRRRADGRRARPSSRRADAGGGRAADPRVAARARPAREARAVPPHGRALRALRDPDRAARSRSSGGARWTS